MIHFRVSIRDCVAILDTQGAIHPYYDAEDLPEEVLELVQKHLLEGNLRGDVWGWKWEAQIIPPGQL